MKYILLGLFAMGCVQTTAPVKEEKPYGSWPNQTWAKEVEKQLIAYGVPELKILDGEQFCPNGMNLRNYVHLLGAVSYYESNYSPSKEYRESFPNAIGEPTISTGLFQLSYHTQRIVYGFQDATTKKLKDPNYNIRAAVHIMHRWLKQDGSIANHLGRLWQGMSRYWSVMRPYHFVTNRQGVQVRLGKLPEVKARMRQWCE